MVPVLAHRAAAKDLPVPAQETVRRVLHLLQHQQRLHGWHARWHTLRHLGRGGQRGVGLHEVRREILARPRSVDLGDAKDGDHRGADPVPRLRPLGLLVHGHGPRQAVPSLPWCTRGSLSQRVVVDGERVERHPLQVRRPARGQRDGSVPATEHCCPGASDGRDRSGDTLCDVFEQSFGF